jgi:hypothetical protein
MLCWKQFLQLSNCYRGQPWFGLTDDLGPDKYAKDKEFLEKYALERWEV